MQGFNVPMREGGIISSMEKFKNITEKLQ
jgi:hypothetical protein